MAENSWKAFCIGSLIAVFFVSINTRSTGLKPAFSQDDSTPQVFQKASSLDLIRKIDTFEKRNGINSQKLDRFLSQIFQEKDHESFSELTSVPTLAELVTTRQMITHYGAKNLQPIPEQLDPVSYLLELRKVKKMLVRNTITPDKWNEKQEFYGKILAAMLCHREKDTVLKIIHQLVEDCDEAIIPYLYETLVLSGCQELGTHSTFRMKDSDFLFEQDNFKTKLRKQADEYAEKRVALQVEHRIFDYLNRHILSASDSRLKTFLGSFSLNLSQSILPPTASREVLQKLRGESQPPSLDPLDPFSVDVFDGYIKAILVKEFSLPENSNVRDLLIGKSAGSKNGQISDLHLQRVREKFESFLGSSHGFSKKLAAKILNPSQQNWKRFNDEDHWQISEWLSAIHSEKDLIAKSKWKSQSLADEHKPNITYSELRELKEKIDSCRKIDNFFESLTAQTVRQRTNKTINKSQKVD